MITGFSNTVIALVAVALQPFPSIVSKVILPDSDMLLLSISIGFDGSTVVPEYQLILDQPVDGLASNEGVVFSQTFWSPVIFTEGPSKTVISIADVHPLSSSM